MPHSTLKHCIRKKLNEHYPEIASELADAL